MIPLTFAITAADWSENQDMLRMMFNCLAKQTVKDFDIIVADHNYVARKDAVAELAEKYALRVKHMPLTPAPHVAKNYIDCSVFNAGWIMSEAERCVRYSEWRFLTPDFVETLLGEPANQVTDFYFHSLEADQLDGVWDRATGEINFERVPRYGETELGPIEMQPNCYANNSVSREKWLDVNGFNEVSFNFYHWEDMDYNARCKHAGFTCKRIPEKMYRMHHLYGAEKNRGNREPEQPFPSVCKACQDITDYVKFQIGPAKHREWSLAFRLNPHTRRVGQGTKTWLVCRQCNFIIPELESDDLWGYCDEDSGYVRSPVNVSGAGRNLRRLSDDLKGKRWSEKIEIYDGSWVNPRYLADDSYYDYGWDS